MGNYQIGNTYRLPIGQCRRELLAILTHNGTTRYQFNLLGGERAGSRACAGAGSPYPVPREHDGGGSVNIFLDPGDSLGHLCPNCRDRYTTNNSQLCHACREQQMIDDAVPTPFDWSVWDEQLDADDNRPSPPMVGVVTVSPEAKQRLIDEYGLTETDFINGQEPDVSESEGEK